MITTDQSQDVLDHIICLNLMTDVIKQILKEHLKFHVDCSCRKKYITI